MKDTFVEFVLAYVPHTTHVHLEVKMAARFSLEVSRPKARHTHSHSSTCCRNWKKNHCQRQPNAAENGHICVSKSLLFFQRKNPTNFSDVLIEFRLNASLQIISKT